MRNILKNIVIARRYDEAISLSKSDCFSSYNASFAMTKQPFLFVIPTVVEVSIYPVNIMNRFLHFAALQSKGRPGLLILILLLISFSANAKILLPQILSSDMVLQRDKPINIWGFASVGERVKVTFAGQQKEAITDKNGNWTVVLNPLKTSAKPQTMMISGSNKIELTNILVGEVWLCSGQSNMEYAMRKLAKIPKPKKRKTGFPVR